MYLCVALMVCFEYVMYVRVCSAQNMFIKMYLTDNTCSSGGAPLNIYLICHIIDIFWCVTLSVCLWKFIPDGLECNGELKVALK